MKQIAACPCSSHLQPPQETDYRYHDGTFRVTHCGRICIGRRNINLSTDMPQIKLGFLCIGAGDAASEESISRAGAPRAGQCPFCKGSKACRSEQAL